MIETPRKTSYKGRRVTGPGCPRCGGASPITETRYKGNGGVMKACCIVCEPDILKQKERATARTAEWRKNKENIRDYRNEEARKYRSINGDKISSYRRKWYKENNERLREYRKNYIKENPWFNRAASSRKRALVRERMPAWADIEELKMFYKNCPEGMVVDHVIPLKGKEISGLHIASNLQYLTFKENSKKSNKYDILSAGLQLVRVWGREL